MWIRSLQGNATHRVLGWNPCDTTDPLSTNPPEEESPHRGKAQPASVEHTVALVNSDPQKIDERLEVREELRRVPFLEEEHNTCVGTAIAAVKAELVHQALKKNVDLFA